MTSKSKNGPDPKEVNFPITEQKQREVSQLHPPKLKHGDRVLINDFEFKVLKVTSNRVVLKPMGFDMPV